MPPCLRAPASGPFCSANIISHGTLFLSTRCMRTAHTPHHLLPAPSRTSSPPQTGGRVGRTGRAASCCWAWAGTTWNGTGGGCVRRTLRSVGMETCAAPSRAKTRLLNIPPSPFRLAGVAATAVFGTLALPAGKLPYHFAQAAISAARALRTLNTRLLQKA